VSARDLEALAGHREHAPRPLAVCIDRLRGRMLGAVVVGLDEAVGAWAAADGKRVELEVEGAATRINGPAAGPLRTAIVQLLRNAIAHGIETPSAREAANKPVVGRLRIVGTTPIADEPPVIEVIDDGGGIDFTLLATRARERGLSTTRDELPYVDGLSVRCEADTLAGRGAGLAAVRDELAAAGYTIEIESEPGVGTTMRLRPVTARRRVVRAM
jgi:two-component system chemotaxis sensor kinase CheA